MAAHWHGVAREAGYDPTKFKDAVEGEGLTAVISLKNMKGATIGDGTNCSGARCLRDQPDIEWAYVGASVAFVAFKDGRLRRFMVNGIPRTQDRTMNVAGEEIILRPPKGTATLRAQRRRGKRDDRRDKHTVKDPGLMARRHRTLAAQLRNSA